MENKFKKLIENVSADELSKQFEVTFATAMRWKAGKTLPAPTLMEFIVRELEMSDETR